MSDEPDVSGEQRELLSRLRVVVEAKDAEIGVLRQELAAERELRRRLEPRLAETGAPSVDGQHGFGDAELEGADRGERDAAGAAAVGAGAQQGP